MKTIAVWSLVLWIGLTLEHAYPAVLPPASLILPVATSCLFWCQHNAASVLLAGVAMILCWTLTPSSAPLEVIAVLVVSAWLTTRQTRDRGWNSSTSGLPHHRWWMHPLIVTVAGITAHTIAATDLTANAISSDCSLRLIIALPCLTLAAIVTRTADELGLRQQRPAA